MNTTHRPRVAAYAVSAWPWNQAAIGRPPRSVFRLHRLLEPYGAGAEGRSFVRLWFETPDPDRFGASLARSGVMNQAAAERASEGAVTLFLGGDVMLGRGVDQILPHPGDPTLRERSVRDAQTYVALVARVNGGISRPVDWSWPWGDALEVARRRQLRCPDHQSGRASPPVRTSLAARACTTGCIQPTSQESASSARTSACCYPVLLKEADLQALTCRARMSLSRPNRVERLPARGSDERGRANLSGDHR
jgi:hypothetical protein